VYQNTLNYYRRFVEINRGYRYSLTELGPSGDAALVEFPKLKREVLEMPKYYLRQGVTYDTNTESSDEPEAGVLDFQMMRTVGDRLTEFFGCFCFFGFDSRGRPVKISHASSSMENYALTSLIEDDLQRQGDGDFFESDDFDDEYDPDVDPEF